MNPQIIQWIMPVGATVYIFLAAAIIVMRSSKERGAAHWVMLAMAGWIIGGTAELLAITPDAMFIGRTIVDICTAALPTLLMMTICYFTAQKLPLTVKALIWIVPSITIGLSVTHALHDLMWSANIENGTIINLPVGPWFQYAHLPHAFAIAIINTWLMARRTWSLSGDQRLQNFTLIIAFSIPVVVSMAHHLDYIGTSISPAPLFAAVTAPLVGWLILRRGVLIENSLEYRLFVEQMADAVIVVDQDLYLVSFNPAGATLINQPHGPTRGLTLPEVLPEAVPILSSFTGAQDVSVGERRLSIKVNRLERGLQQSHAIIVCRDITSEWAARSDLMRSEELLRSLVNNSSNAILRLRRFTDDAGNTDYKVLVANPIAAAFFNIGADDLIGRDINDAFEQSVFDDTDTARLTIARTLELAVEGGQSEHIEFSLQSPKGLRWYRMMADPVGTDIGIVCFDITRQREQKIRLETEAFQDPLTGVLNRRGFERLASQCLASQSDDEPGALLFVDLNDFKRVNDELGHETGDWVLRQLGKRLHDVTGDNHILGRLGGDEFVVLATNLTESEANQMQQMLHTALAEPYRFNDQLLIASASVGMALFPAEGVTLTSLMRHADASMYVNKADARSAGASEQHMIRPSNDRGSKTARIEIGDSAITKIGKNTIDS